MRHRASARSITSTLSPASEALLGRPPGRSAYSRLRARNRLVENLPLEDPVGVHSRDGPEVDAWSLAGSGRQAAWRLAPVYNQWQIASRQTIPSDTIGRVEEQPSRKSEVVLAKQQAVRASCPLLPPLLGILRERPRRTDPTIVVSLRTWRPTSADK
jgi:hypothetical protein